MTTAHSPETVAIWLERLEGHEGAYSDDPKDDGNWTGGKAGVGICLGTKFGIAANTYPTLDIKNLTIEDAAAIYCRDFLGPMYLDRFVDGLAWQFLDFAVNSGVGNATRGLQRAADTKDDGVIGPKTIAAIGRMSETDAIMRLVAERLFFLTGCRTWLTHGRGWTRRMAQNLRYGAEDS